MIIDGEKTWGYRVLKGRVLCVVVAVPPEPSMVLDVSLVLVSHEPAEAFPMLPLS